MDWQESGEKEFVNNLGKGNRMKKIRLAIYSLASVLFLAGVAGAQIEESLPVPEPSTILLFTAGLVGLGILKKKGFKK